MRSALWERKEVGAFQTLAGGVVKDLVDLGLGDLIGDGDVDVMPFDLKRGEGVRGMVGVWPGVRTGGGHDDEPIGPCGAGRSEDETRTAQHKEAGQGARAAHGMRMHGRLLHERDGRNRGHCLSIERTGLRSSRQGMRKNGEFCRMSPWPGWRVS